jgi:hypothetical protein
MSAKPGGRTAASRDIEAFKDRLGQYGDSPSWFHKKYVRGTMEYETFLEYINGYETMTTGIRDGIKRYMKEHPKKDGRRHPDQ